MNPNENRKLEIRYIQEDGFYVENLCSAFIQTINDLIEILEIGELNRITASHALNEHSSRSHSVLTIKIHNETNNDRFIRHGKLIFVDLAGI